MRELQTFSFISTKLPGYVTITIIIVRCPINPVNNYGYGRKCLDELVQVRNAKWLNHRPLIKTSIRF